MLRLRCRPEFGELDGGDHGPRPGPEILGRELAAHDFLDVRVQVPGLDVANLAAIIHVLEDLVAWQFYTLLHHLAQPAIRDDLPVSLAPLSAVLEGHGVACNMEELAPERHYAVGPVMLR